MLTERQLQEMVARCVATMVYFHDAPKTQQTKILMNAEVQAHAAWVSGLNLGERGTDESILRPVESELIARYGHAAGHKCFNEFAKAFAGLPEPIPVHHPVEA